jgi:hypothetical protein
MGRSNSMRPGSTEWLWAVRWTSAAALAAASLTLGTAQVDAQPDSAATILTFDNTLIHKEKTGFFRSYPVGTLLVSPTALTFRSAKAEVGIPLESIRSFHVGGWADTTWTDKLVGGGNDERWLIVRYEVGALRAVLGFGDGQRRRGNRPPGDRTVEIRDAIARMLGPDHCPEPSSKDALLILGRRFVDSVAKQGFPSAPARLISDPNTTGMLILDGDIDGKDLTGAALIRKGDQPCIARSGAAGLNSADGVILFTGLSPGRYIVRIVSEEHEVLVGTGHLHPSTFTTIREAVDNSLEMNEYLRGLRQPREFRLDAQDLAVTIEAGDVHYLGRAHFKSWPGDLAVPVLEPDPVRERKVRELLLDRYPGTRWAWLARE